MTYVIQQPCIDCKYGDCVEVCPVDCFYEGPKMLFINPAECIDCNACVPECPVSAIVPDSDADNQWIEANANFEYTEDKRRTKKANVTHGPKYDPMKQARF